MKKSSLKLAPPLANERYEERNKVNALFLYVAADVTKINLAAILEQIEIKQVQSL